MFRLDIGGGDEWALIELSFTHITSKTWAHSGKFGYFRIFFRLKKRPPPAKSLFEITMGNPFFGTPFFGTKRSTKFFQIINCIALYQKNCFQNRSWTLGSARTRKHMKYPNTHICKFSGSGTSQGPGSNPKAVF